ncbi:TRAP transporter 4TM/12TM fusion protein [Halanaeroarchaeum sulfurireducens]|uniref:TRAP transporter 4TM/12TM fusion protein n=2 Tax=Halanaeroarchaeum sulfurireducens TaxID=1604004 RepID=A0A0F7PAA1_9EURY|nr:TRAP transporter fused permease subunit [Halanaeroarchaeum sulfurireducens]AKH96549.1 TRAP transporter 4TM/12TM fusion protein [Halanaeroarchaeum sulfurireducens]
MDDTDTQTNSVASGDEADPIPATADTSMWPTGHEESGYRKVLELLTTYGSVPFWLMIIYYASTQFWPRAKYGVLFLGGTLLLYILSELPDAIEDRDYLDVGAMVASAIISAITTGYLFFNFERLYVGSLGYALPHEYAIAAAFTLAIIFLTWRSFGSTFLIVVIVGIGYGLVGPWMPGVLQHGGLTTTRTLRVLVLSMDGFFGFLNQLVAAWIALFLLFAGLLKTYGAFDLIFRVAVRSAKYLDSGIAQTAVIASAIIGSINGSQTANAGMTGSFTIPLMKDAGVRPESAAAIESVASTSGQVLPPVMGAGAFIMASLITGITYVDVIIAGLIPAAILLISIFLAVHYVAAPQIGETDPTDHLDTTMSRSSIAFESVKYGIPLFILIYYLGIVQYTVMTSALYTAVSMIAMGVIIPVLRSLTIDEDPVPKTIRRVIVQTVDGFREGIIVLAPVAIILASINGVVDILMATAVPTAISLALMDLSGGVMLIGVILAMVISILLGLGMPTTAAYTVVALLIAPSLISQFFVPELASHFFVFYAAILAGLTPPIATTVAVAAGIAGGDFWGSAYDSIKISLPLFVLPFTFVYHPEILGGNLAPKTLIAGAAAMIGAIAMIHGINYRFPYGSIRTYATRAVFFAVGVVAMTFPDRNFQYGAIAIIAVLFGLHYLQKKTDVALPV